jgi:hypothetical protein
VPVESTTFQPTLTEPTIDASAVRAYLEHGRQTIGRHAGYLTRLDFVLGDGDHGDNLVIGFRAVADMLDELPGDTRPGELLRAVGHRLVAAVGGASGPLYGTAFIEAGFRTVDDQGIGVPEADRRLVLEPFHRAGNVRESRIPGTGLGLYICRRLVEAHGGELRIDDRPDGRHGTRISFSLPLLPNRGRGVPGADQPRSGQSRSGRSADRERRSAADIIGG